MTNSQVLRLRLILGDVELPKDDLETLNEELEITDDEHLDSLKEAYSHLLSAKLILESVIEDATDE